MKNQKYSYDKQFDQVCNEAGATIVLTWGKTATLKDRAVIAAAPELLEALVKLLDIATHPFRGGSDEHEYRIKCFEDTRNLIAKAKGETQS